MAIVMALVALTFPVFVTAKAEALRAACASNFKQVYFASTLYQVDYDDRYVVSKYTGAQGENAATDRTWVQLVYPYLRSFGSTKCPADHSQRPGMDPIFDSNLMVGTDIERYYTASTRANTG